MSPEIYSHSKLLKREPVGRVAVYNRYLKTFGGGERSSLEFARAFEDLGYDITLVTDPGSNIDLKKLNSVFGIAPRNSWELVEVDHNNLDNYFDQNFHDIFVNHTFSSYINNPCPVGIYSLMFPHDLNSYQLEALRSYKTIVCNSTFTEQYLKIRWSKNLPSFVLPPPISTKHFDYKLSPKTKEKLIINIGRFNIEGHSKCQKEAIEAFIKLKTDNILDSEWKMIVAGHLNEGQDNQNYFDYCCGIDPDNVKVLKNLSFDELINLYSRASVLFQFTGFGLDYGEIPDRCEHLGLVAMDALCYSTIPVVFERSGVALMCNWGDSVYSFADHKELEQIMRYFSQDFAGVAHLSHMRRCRAVAESYSYDSFLERISDVINS